MLTEHKLKGEVLVKPITHRSQGFAELKDFDATKALASAQGGVWQVVCLGPHHVEKLGAACRALEADAGDRPCTPTLPLPLPPTPSP